MAAEFIGFALQSVRERLARLLVRAGLRPDHVTVLGVLFTAGAGIAIAAGRPYWRPWGLALLLLAGACDMLDGSMAKVGNLGTRFGGILDSCCDRISDFALYAGLALYFAAQPDATDAAARQPNLTLILLAFLGMGWAFLISYIKARAENTVPSCGGGFWQRGERVVTVLIGLAFMHLTTIVWILGLWPITTVAHRLWRARRTAAMMGSAGAVGETEVQPKGLLAVVLWRWGRKGLPFDIHIGVPILMLIFWDIPPIDPLRQLWGGG
jgi:CDP-diacylglycerol--glycerol-3-phosphate 3-phosphatidyltransferase